MPTQNPIDPIIEEIHAVRRAIAERFDYDLHRIVEDARRRQEASGAPEWHSEAAAAIAKDLFVGKKQPPVD